LGWKDQARRPGSDIHLGEWLYPPRPGNVQTQKKKASPQVVMGLAYVAKRPTKREVSS